MVCSLWPTALGLAVGLVVPVEATAGQPVHCGPSSVKHEITKHKGHHPVPEPSAGKAMVVIALGKSFTKSYQQKLAANGEWRAVLKESQYSYFEVEPGMVQLCWGGRGPLRDDQILLITARPGETYYIRGTLTDISEVHPVQAGALLHKKTYVTHEVRP